MSPIYAMINSGTYTTIKTSRKSLLDRFFVKLNKVIILFIMKMTSLKDKNLFFLRNEIINNSNKPLMILINKDMVKTKYIQTLKVNQGKDKLKKSIETMNLN